MSLARAKLCIYTKLYRFIYKSCAAEPVLAGDRHAGLGAPSAAKRPRRACWRSEHRSGRPGSMRPRGATLRVRASATFASHTRQHVLAGDRRELVCVCTSTLSLTTRRRTSDSQRAESRRAARGELRTAAAPRSIEGARTYVLSARMGVSWLSPAFFAAVRSARLCPRQDGK